MMESRSGLSVTAPMGAQFRVSPDQRAGLRSRALRYKEGMSGSQNRMIVPSVALLLDPY